MKRIDYLTNFNIFKLTNFENIINVDWGLGIYKKLLF